LLLPAYVSADALATITIHAVDPQGSEIGPKAGKFMVGTQRRRPVEAADAKAKFTFRDLPIPASAATGALRLEGSKTLANVSTITGPDHSVLPLDAMVKWRLEMK
jgi:hypothetical protein